MTLTPEQMQEGRVKGGMVASARRANEASERRYRMLELLRDGVTVKDAIAEIGVTDRTWRNWRRDHKEFRAATDAVRGMLDPDRDTDALKLSFTAWRKKYLDSDTTWFQAQLAEAIDDESIGGGTITLCLFPPEHGKRFRLDEPVPTPQGWTTMGELAPGDELFARDGSVTTVKGVSPVERVPAYRVVLSDGNEIEAGADHRWLVRCRDFDGERIIDTAELHRRTAQAKSRPVCRIPVADALELPDADLPLDPYALGAWLSDGHTDAARITCPADPEIIEHTGLTVSKVYADPSGRPATWAFTGLKSTLRELGVLGAKHIPSIYLRASIPQRQALLEGLMDTDGSCSTAGQCEFTTTDPRLADDVEELIWTLGHRVRRYKGTARLDGVDCGPKYRLSFYPDRPVFRLARKADRQNLARRQGERMRWRTVTAVEPIDDLLGVCISVTHPDRLYLAGRSFIVSHNTTLVEDYITWKFCVNKGYRVTYGSESQAHSRKALRRVRNRLEIDGPFPRLVSDYGPFAPAKRSWDHQGNQPWGQDFFDIYGRDKSDERDYSMVALGFGSQIAGSRTDLLVGDDLTSMRNNSQAPKLLETFRQDWLSRPGTKGRTVIIGTRVADGDLYDLMEQADLPDRIVRFKAHDPARIELFDTPWLWPDRYDEDEYAKMRKNVGEAAWARNYQQAPRLAGDSTFTDEMIENAKVPLRSVIHNPPEGTVGIVVGLDPGFGINATVGLGAAKDRCHVLGGRKDVGLTNNEQIMAACEQTYLDARGTTRLPWLHLVIEDKAFQKGLLDDAAMKDLQRKYGFSVHGHQTGINKYDENIGIPAMARDFRREVIELPGGTDPDTERFMVDFVPQMLRWRPNVKGTALEMDLVMAFWFGWLWWSKFRDALESHHTNRQSLDTGGLPWRPTVLPGGMTRMPA